MKRAILLKSMSILFAVLVCAIGGITVNAQTPKKAATPADIKIRQKMTSEGSDKGMETAIYIKGARMRSEMASAGMGMTNIVQCDLKRTIMINDKARTYLIMNEGEKTEWGPGVEGDGGGAPPAATATPNAQPAQPKRGGVVNITNTITDTGERKEMFGFTARHIKTSMVREASPEACDTGNHKSESDGWYIDFQYGLDCPTQKVIPQTSPIKVRPDCEDEVRTKTIGAAKLGFPVLMTTTTHQEGGKTSAMTIEVSTLR